MPFLEVLVPAANKILEILELRWPQDGPYFLSGSQPDFTVSTVCFVSRRAVKGSTLLQDLSQLRALFIIQFDGIGDSIQYSLNSPLGIYVSPPPSGMRLVATSEGSRLDQEVGQSPTKNTSDHEDEEDPKNGPSPTRQ